MSGARHFREGKKRSPAYEFIFDEARIFSPPAHVPGPALISRFAEISAEHRYLTMMRGAVAAAITLMRALALEESSRGRRRHSHGELRSEARGRRLSAAIHFRFSPRSTPPAKPPTTLCRMPNTLYSLLLRRECRLSVSSAPRASH